MEFNLEKRVWWGYVEDDLRKLLESSVFILATVKSWGGDLPNGSKVFSDYSFCVFPAAKAYEGFLKKVFLDLGFITKDDYYGKHFRIGKALNPFLEKKYRNESVYDKVVQYCGGKALADQLWDAWRNGRNLIFHWFPDEKKVISFSEAEELIVKILNAMDKVFEDCKIE